MKTITEISSVKNNTGVLGSVKKAEPKVLAKEIETVFMNQFVKAMMDQTSFAKDKVINNYMPFITSEISRTIAERGMGIGDFFMRNPVLNPPDAGAKKENGGEKESRLNLNKYKVLSGPVGLGG